MVKEKLKILIKTDGNNTIGMGHISRCISLAKEFEKHECEIHFLTSKNSKKFLKNFGKCHITNNIENDEILLIKKIKPDIFLLDILKKFFTFSKKYFLNIKKITKLLVAIDFSSTDLKYFDISFHSLFGPKKFMANETYHDLKFSIVNSNFYDVSKNFSIKKIISNILILSGGADTNCIGPKILSSLAKLSSDVKIGIVLGPHFDCWDELNKEKPQFQNNLKVYYNVKNMANVMKNFQLAISAAGVTSTELLTIGIPTIIVYGDPHEREAATALEQQKTVINLGYGKNVSKNLLVKTIDDIIADYKLRKKLNKTSKKIFNGQGAIIITTKILDYYALLKESEKFD